MKKRTTHRKQKKRRKEKNRYLNKRKTRSTKELSEKPTKLKKLDCNICGAPKWSRKHKCPAKGKKCPKSEKTGHYAKYCNTNKRVNHVQDNEASSAEEDDWSPNTIHSVNHEVHSTRQTKKNGPEFFTLTALVKNRQIYNQIYNRQWSNGNFNTKITVQQSNTTDANWNRI